MTDGSSTEYTGSRAPDPGGERSGCSDPGGLDGDDLADLVGSGAELFFVWEPEGTLRWANEAGLASVDLATAVLEHAAEARPGSGVGPATDLVGNRAGEQRWWAWSAWRDPDGTLYLSANDVTDTHYARRARQVRADAMRTLIGRSAPAITVKDLLGRVVLTNVAAERGPEGRGVAGPGAVAEPAGPGALDPVERRVMRSGVVDIAEQVEHGVGGDRLSMVVRFVLRDDAGVVSHIASVATDITGRAAAQQRQAEHQRVLSALIQLSPDLVALVDGTGHLVDISAAAFSSLGLEASATESDLMARLVPRDAGRLGLWTRRLVAGEAVEPLRYSAMHVDGRMLTFDAVGIPVTGPAGDPSRTATAAVVVARDVTDMVRGEAELQRALGLAEHDNRAKSQLLARMGNELRAPLDTVLSAAQSLAEAQLAPAQFEAVAHVIRACRHLGDLVGEVAEVAKPVDGAGDAPLVAVALGGVVEDAVALARPLADGQKVRLIVAAPMLFSTPGPLHELTQGPSCGPAIGDGEARWPWVLADRQRLLQVLLNLLSNAIKYNRPAGTVRVSVSGTGGRVRLAVADTGPGIDRAHFDRIFEPFDRLGAEHGSVAGTGVGLTVTKRFVEAMGGTIEVHSVVGTGSVFAVELAEVSAPGGEAGTIDDAGGLSPPGAEHHRRGGGSRSSSLPGRRKLRVLVVEDDVASSQLVCRVLERRGGVEVVQAADGAGALALAREAPDLVLLDLGLPDIAGGTILARLRQDPATATIPVVILSADATDPQVDRLVRAGAAAYLTKPLSVGELVAIVDAVAAGRAL